MVFFASFAFFATLALNSFHLSYFRASSLRTLRLNSLLMFVFSLFVAIGYAVFSMISQWSL